jgi:hypothetical protein
MGRSLVIRGDSDQVFKVTGVLAEVPANSHVRFDALASMSTFRSLNPDGDFLNSWDGDGSIRTWCWRRASRCTRWNGR